MQKVRDIDNHCLVTCQQRATACELVHTKLVPCWILSTMSLKSTPASAAAGFHNHKRNSCWSAKLVYDFCCI